MKSKYFGSTTLKPDIQHPTIAYMTYVVQLLHQPRSRTERYDYSTMSCIGDPVKESIIYFANKYLNKAILLI